VPLKRLFNTNSKFQLSETDTKAYNYYKKYSVEELVAIVKRQDDFDLDKKPKEIALHNLLNRNISLEGLKSEGLEISDKLIKANTLHKDYKDYSKTSLISFSTGGLFLILHFILKNNKFVEIAEVSLSLSLVAFLFFIIYFTVDAIVYSKFYKTLGLINKRINPILLVLSLPLYPLKYIFLRNKIAQDFYRSCLQNIK
jgi:lipopolysaccharide export system permease protein